MTTATSVISASDWLSVFPEALLLGAACFVALFDLFVKSERRSPSLLLSVFVLLGLTGLCGWYALGGQTVYGFGGMFVSDPFGNWLKAFAAAATALTLVYGQAYAAKRDMLRGGELFTLSLLALLGIFVMIGSSNMLMLYLGLELLTLSSYALVALRRDHALSTEAAIKYFVLGALASGFLLYGMSMIYGATGSLNMAQIAKAVAVGSINKQVLILGLVFLVAGAAFKLGVVPFHMWVADVYQGAPTVVTLLIAGAPKFAAFALVVRLLVDGLLPLAIDWQQMLLFLSIASLLVGNLAAIAQSNVKRMLAFSTIAQLAFVLLAMASGVVFGAGGVLNASGAANAYSSAMFYVLIYVLTTLLVFGVLLLLAADGYEADSIADLAGLNQRSPLYAALLGLGMFSLAGIPPLAGFYAKFAVLQAMVTTQQTLLLGVAIFAVVMSLIGAFYYLRVIKVMYFDDPIITLNPTPNLATRVALLINASLVVVLGVLPSPLLDASAEAIKSLLMN